MLKLGLGISLTDRIGAQSAVDPDAADYISRAETNGGGTLAAYQEDAIIAFVEGCKADPSRKAGVSNWQASYQIAILSVWPNIEGALTLVKGTAPVDFNDGFVSGDYDTANGLQGDGVKSLKTGVTQLPQDNHALLVNLASFAVSSGFLGIGGQGFSNSFPGEPVHVAQDATTTLTRSNTSGASGAARGSTPGLTGVVRETSSQYYAIANGTTVLQTVASTTPQDSEFTIFSRNGDGDLFDGQINFYVIGEAIDEQALITRLDTLFSAAFDPEPAEPVIPADYTVTTDAEWDTVFANNTATLDGSIIEVQGANMTDVGTIMDHDFTEGITIRSENAAAKVPGLRFEGTVRNVELSGLNIQVLGWPRSTGTGAIDFATGTFNGIKMSNGTTVRHGYGASLVDFDPTTIDSVPEVQMTANTGTATTTATVVAISWQDDTISRTDGWITFFNTGAEGIYVKTDGSGTINTGSDELVPAGGSTRLTGLSPAGTPEITVMSASGSPSFNARTEFGIPSYLASAFRASGSANFEDGIEIRNCEFSNLSNAIKGARVDLVMDCDFKLIYQDIFSNNGQKILRNIMDVPFAQYDHAQNPHGDLYQYGSNGTITKQNIIVAGNRQRFTPNYIAQGIFFSDNDADPSYEQISVINDMMTGGQSNGIDVGEFIDVSNDYPAKDIFIYGVTCLDAENPTTGTTFAQVYDKDYYSFMADSVIFGGGGAAVEDNVLRLQAESSPASFLPNHSQYATAQTRSEIETAWEISGHTGGMAATTNVIDWTTTDPDQVVRWDQIPSGAHWRDLLDQPLNTTVTTPLATVQNRATGQAVVPGSGVEWRSEAQDGTELQAWTSGSGTIEPYEKIQLRFTTSATEDTTLTFSISINGFTEETDVATFVPSWSTDGTVQFADPDTFDVTWNQFVIAGRIRMQGETGTVPRRDIWGGTSRAVEFAPRAENGGQTDVRVEDSSGNFYFGGSFTDQRMKMDQWIVVVQAVDFTNGETKIYIDGELIQSDTRTPSASEFPSSSRNFKFLGGLGNDNYIGDVAFLKLWKGETVGANGELPTATPSEEITGDAAQANAHPWLVSGTAVQN